MASAESKSLDTPDETRTPDKTMVSVVHLGPATIARLQVEPGWRWSECIKPVVGGESCQVDHVGYVASGRLGVTHQDGSQVTLSPGEAYRIAPGHDAWVEGDEDFVGYEFKSAASYAKA